LYWPGLNDTTGTSPRETSLVIVRHHREDVNVSWKDSCGNMMLAYNSLLTHPSLGHRSFSSVGGGRLQGAQTTECFRH